MKRFKTYLSIFILSAILLVGCSTDTTDEPLPDQPQDKPVDSSEEMQNLPEVEDNKESEDDREMVHDQSGDIPKGLKEAENPTYKVGDKVEILTDHMKGMKGAEATIVGAFDTIVYAVSYDPTNGHPREENHKWVIHEEIVDAGEDRLKDGAEVVIKANHMPGMEGASATIESSEETTIYMIDYMPTTEGKHVKNHKWLTDSEIKAK